MKVLGVAGIIILVLIILVVLISHYENRHFKVATYHISAFGMPEKPGGLRIAVISDLHDQEYGAGNERLLAALRQQQPDIVLAAGDLVIGRPGADNTPALHLVSELAKAYPVYMAMGNHEYRMKIYPGKYGNMWNDYYTATTEAGAKWLDNRTVYITWNPDTGLVYQDTLTADAGHSVALTGFTMDACYYKRFRQTPMAKDYVQTCCNTVAPQSFQILLAHNPDYFERYAQYGADLVISGHVHGGMIRIPGIGGLLSPMGRLFPKYDKGLYTIQNTSMLVCAGLGNHTFKFRVNNRPELVMIHLGAADRTNG